jgi:cytochrome P450
VNQLINQTLAQGEVDPLPYVRLSAVNIMLTVIYGIPTLKSPEDPFYKKIVYIIEMGMKFIGPLEDFSAFLPVLSFLDVMFRKERRMRNFFETVSYPVFTKLVADARTSSKDSLTKKIDLIKEDLELDERNVTVILSKYLIYHTLHELMLSYKGETLVGGSDTVSVTTVWTYVILCNYRDVQQKVIKELDEFIEINKRLPTFDDRLQLPYYNAFQKECLRFRPASYVGIPKKANKDGKEHFDTRMHMSKNVFIIVIYKNYLIPKGSILVSNLHTLHFDENLYHQPEQFIPERFLENEKTLYANSNGNVNNRDQFIFGWGRRICPGIAIVSIYVFRTICSVI